MEDRHNTFAVVAAVAAERKRQDTKWGQQNHDPFKWLAILQEKVGEASKSALETESRLLLSTGAIEDTSAVLNRRAERDEHMRNYRQELIQVAAVAVAMVECVDRDQWFWGSRT
jgi:hypothetical protein